jgi:acyl-CoA synthetase (NDP forming)
MPASTRISPQKPIYQMDFLAAQKMAQKYGISIIPTFPAHSEHDLLPLPKKIPFPWVMKAIGKTLIHKSDVGGVKLNLSNLNDATIAFHALKEIKGCEYVAVQPQRKGIELIVGGKMDPQFGPTLLLGMGGIYTEVFKDSTLRICPVSDEDIAQMIQELKIYPILRGIRGQKGIDFGKLHQLLKGVSQLMVKEGISELDLNPIIATPKSVEAVDVRIIK